MLKLAIVSTLLLLSVISARADDNDDDYYAGLPPELRSKINLNDINPISIVGHNGITEVEENGISYLAVNAKSLGLKMIVMQGVDDCDKVEVAGLRCIDIRHADIKDARKMEKAFDGEIPTLASIGAKYH